MTRYDSKTQVGGGYYFNTTSWALHAVDGKRGELPGEANEKWVALNSPMMIVAAAVVSFAFVLFLPVVGLLLFGKVVGAAAFNSARTALRALMHALSPRWQPGEAWLARPEGKKSEPEPSALTKEVAERREAEKGR